MMVVGGVSVRSILRAILAVALLLGSGAAEWAAPVPGQAHECCCGTVPASIEDSCPCPKPEGNRGPQRSTCTERQVVVATQAVRRGEPGPRRTEPRPEPTSWAALGDAAVAVGFAPRSLGRDPDLGQHLARLGAFRI